MGFRVYGSSAEQLLLLAGCRCLVLGQQARIDSGFLEGSVHGTVLHSPLLNGEPARVAQGLDLRDLRGFCYGHDLTDFQIASSCMLIFRTFQKGRNRNRMTLNPKPKTLFPLRTARFGFLNALFFWLQAPSLLVRVPYNKPWNQSYTVFHTARGLL